VGLKILVSAVQFCPCPPSGAALLAKPPATLTRHAIRFSLSYRRRHDGHRCIAHPCRPKSPDGNERQGVFASDAQESEVVPGGARLGGGRIL
jgi:hypothetical protein